ncbi:hypothetical protein [Amycolatopsis vastitatis]|uniref:hypothetical protein n=1 Tax=Amycolatopsis vastitatis TaxID=1905142 RepID=UPI00130471EE|nr:hypothetical protein [Amycolatopsis vastitatis]
MKRPKPTVVLVHGAFEDASAWAPVTEVDSPHAIVSADPDAVVDAVHRATR